MKQVFDTNEILFVMLNESIELKSMLSGGVYNCRRPLNSELEDVVVNTITLSQDYAPQIGTSNINIHVPDSEVNISNVQQRMPNNARMRVLSEKVLELVRGIIINGLSVYVDSQALVEEPDINQHFVNIRIKWYIIN